jgi:streptogramin lyase
MQIVTRWKFNIPMIALALSLTATASLAQNGSPLGLQVNMPAGIVGQSYSGSVSAVNGSKPYTFSETGALPTGFAWQSSGNILALTGRPTVAGSYPLSVTAVDANGQTLTQSVTLQITSPPSAQDSNPVNVNVAETITTLDSAQVTFPLIITPSTIPAATLGVTYGPISFIASGGTQSGLALSTSGNVPPGMYLNSLSSVASLGGTPSAAGTYTFMLTATDSAGEQTSVSHTLTISAITIVPATIPSPATVGLSYAGVAFYATGGPSNLVVTESGTVPPGLTFVSDNQYLIMSGTPTKPGTYPFTLSTTDAAISETVTQNYSLTVSMPVLTFSAPNFGSGIATRPFDATISLVNPPSGYSLGVSGTLPPGLTAAASGTTITISGTPTLAGNFPITVTDTDRYGNSEPRDIAILITPAPAITITSSISPAAPIYTDDVVLTTTVTGNYATPGPTGLLFLSVDGVFGASGLPQNGPTTSNLGRLAPGTHTVVYTYGTDAFYPAVSQSYTFTVAYPPYALLGTSRNFNTSTSGSNAEAFDSKGNLYLSNSSFNFVCYCQEPGVIYKIDPQGNLTTFPTTGLIKPNGIAIDGNDNVYVSDAGTKSIVEITQAGVQSVLPIFNTLQYPGNLAFDATHQNLYIVDNSATVFQYNFALHVINNLASIANAGGVAVSPAGKVYIGTAAGYVRGSVYTYDPATTTTTQLPLPTLNSPTALAFDHAGNLYIGDGYLYRLDASNTVLTPMSNFGGNALAVDPRGNIDVLGGQSVVQYTPGPGAYGGASTALKGSYYTYPGPTMALFYTSPASVTLSSGVTPSTTDFYVPNSYSTACYTTSLCALYLSERPQLPGVETGGVTVTFSDGTQIVTPLYGSGYQAEVGLSPGNTSQLTTHLNTYGGATTDQNGVVYVTDTAANAVYRMVSGTPSALAFTGLNAPTQLAVDGTGAVFVLDSGTSRILELDSTGKQSVVFDLKTQNALSSLTAFAMDGGTNLWLGGANTAGSGSIFEFSAASSYSRFATGIQVPAAMAFDINANLDVVDAATGTLNQFNNVGVSTVLATGLTATSSMAIEPSGTVYLAGGSNATLTQIPPGGAAVQYPIAGITVASVVAVDKTGSLTVGDNSTHLLTFNDRTTQAFAFGNVLVGTTSSTQQTTVTNVGNQGGLAFNSLPGDGTFPQDPTSTTCNTTSTVLAAAASCLLGVQFKPTQVFFYSDPGLFGMNIPTQSNGGSNFQVPITGNGVVQLPVTTNSPLNFGSVAPGNTATQTLVLTNTNNKAVSVNVTVPAPFAAVAPFCTTIAANSSCSMSITFTPATAGATTSTGTVTDSTGNSTLFTLTGTDVPLATTTNSPLNSPLNFGSVVLGNTAAQTLIITNPNSVAVSVSIVVPAPFKSVAPICSTIAANSSCSMALAFTPSVVGTATGSGTVTDATGNSTTFTLTGLGLPLPTLFVVGSGGVGSLFLDGTQQSAPLADGGIGMAVDNQGFVWSIDTGGASISTFTDAGAFASRYSGGGMNAATALAIDGAGQVWVANGDGTISVFTHAGAAAASTSLAAAGNLSSPASIAVDTAGSLWIANSGNNTVTEVIGAATPITTPTVQQVISATPGLRP